MTDEDLRELELYLCKNTDAGNIVKNTGGVRKLRWAIKGKGKSGGIRVIYVDFMVYEKLYLIYVYPKSKKEDISAAEKKEIRKLVNTLENELKGAKQ